MAELNIRDYINMRDADVARNASHLFATGADDPSHRTRLERMVAVMLAHFLPELRGRDVGGIVDRTFRNHISALYDTSTERQGNYLALLDQLVELADEDRFTESLSKRCIYCGFHLDSYRLLPAYLRYKSDRPVGMLVGPSWAQTRQDEVNAIGASALPDAEARTGIQLFNAASLDGLSQAMQFIANDGLLFIYIDGHSGVGGATARHDSMATIPFLGGHIIVRPGVAQLSSRLGLPIVPLYIENLDNGCRRLHCVPEVPPPARGERDAQIETTRQLYAILEERIRCKPESWEGWFYVNRSMGQLSAGEIAPPERGTTLTNMPLTHIGKVVFAHDAYTLLPYPNQSVLMCRRRLSYQIVSGATADVLARAFKEPIDAATAAPAVIMSALISAGALVPWPAAGA